MCFVSDLIIFPWEVLFLKRKKHLFLLILVLVGIIAATGILSTRIDAEQSNRTYDLVLDYTSVKDMADKSDNTLEFWLEHFRSLGVDKLGLPEATLTSLNTDHPSEVYVIDVKTLCNQYGWQSVYPAVVQELMQVPEKDDVVVICSDPDLAAWIQDAFSRRCTLPVASALADNGDTVFYLTGDGETLKGSDLLSFPLGIDPALQALAEDLGYSLIPRSTPLKKLNSELYAKDLLQTCAQLQVPYLIITGEQVPGLEDAETYSANILDYLKQTGSSLAVVETSQQSMNLVSEPLTKLVAASGENAVRVFSMWDYIQWRYKWYGYEGSEEIVNCMYRAVNERNCRVVYLKMMIEQLPNDNTEYITDSEAYTVMLNDFAGRMEKAGWKQQTVHPMGEINVGYIWAVGVALGAIAAAVLLLDLFIPLKKNLLYLLTAVGCVGAAGVLWLMPNTGRIILSIGGGIVMPLLAAALLADYLSNHTKGGNLLLACTGAMTGTALLSLVGGLFASAPLSDSSFMLEMELYRGVKFMQLIPLAGFVCYVLLAQFREPCLKFLKQDSGKRKAAVDAFLNRPILVKNLLIALLGAAVAAVFALVGSYYLARTGHTSGATTTDLEMILRNALEYYLPARPRTKEFLIGYPCIMLYVWCRRKNLNWLSVVPGLGAVVGLTSIVNTFLHIRTTFMLSLIRVTIGFGFGLVIGLIVVATAEILYRFMKKRIFHV